MQPNLSTTPFGRRPLTLAMVASQVAAKARPPEAVVHKWQAFRAICEGRAAIGVTDRALAVLNALLTFHPETTLTGEGDIVVFPSNEQLTLRSHGMAPATLRRHLAVLVNCGLIIRRDSPNGKRYARKGQGGAIQNAFGFDLTPIVARAAEFEELAEAARAEHRALALVRERITLGRRDIVKMIATGIEEDVPGDWPGFHAAYVELAARIPRTATLAELDPLAGEMTQLAEQIRKLLEGFIKTQKMNANESHSERHIQNSNTNLKIESEHGLPISHGPTIEPKPDRPRSPQRSYPLGMVLDACPDIVDYARHGINSWRDLVATAGMVRSIIGISPSAWEDANEVLGPEDAAVAVAAIVQRSDAIKSAGGYLRSLTEKARAGSFSLGPVLMALIRTKRKDRKHG
ncbi:plasmid replication protein RepC [Methylocapsa aurea]|uniref:plasmid replication protein RepC n=1 Tax=Methylocapsa aurea TaxID=663610 RepID=UPI00056106E7|nr:plasmid replication protein RepC [Methylocapsa aurea]